MVTRERALEEVWGGEAEASRRTSVDRYVAYLRRKLGDPPLIHTVRGVGFVLDAVRRRALAALRVALAAAAAIVLAVVLLGVAVARAARPRARTARSTRPARRARSRSRGSTRADAASC